MKTSNLTQIAQAALTANLAGNLAVLVANLNQPEDGWVQLLPAGKFKARDGRPFDTEDGHWHLDAIIAAQMIAATKASAPKVLIDYEHQTLHAAENGKPAPAAGWLTSDSDIEWREGQGLYIKPGWTKAAQTHIDNDEYAFLSAVFPYDKQGRPLMLRMAAITNDPGVVGMESLAALYAGKTADFSLRFNNHNGQAGSEISLYGQMEDTKVDEILKQLLARLGIEVSDALTPEQGQAALTAFDAAKRKGQIVEAETGYLKQFGQQQGVAALSAMLEKRPAIAALTAQQTTTNPPPAGDPGKESLTEEELAVLRACDLDKDAFLKAKQENAE